jgi:copper chaperone CopZ
MKRFLGLAALCAALAAAGCFRNTVSEMELSVPAMRSEACAKLVGDAVAKLGVGPFEPIREIQVDLAERKVRVKFDNVRLGRRNVEVAVRHAGFAVNDFPADEEARAKLPEGCRGDE